MRHAEVLENGELGVRPAAHARRRPTGSSSAAARTSSSRPRRSTASATPRSPAGPGELTADSLEAVVVHSDLRRTGHFECSDDAAQPAAPQRGLGAARQLPRRAHRLPAARRAARLDRRHRRVRPDGGVPLRRRATSSATGWSTSAVGAAGRRTAWCPSWCPTSSSTCEHPTEFPAPEHGRDLERRGRVGAVGAVAGVRRP